MEVVAAWLFTHRSWNTRIAYGADLSWFAAWCEQHGREPLDATQGDVEAYRSDVEAAGASPALTRRRLAALTSFFRYASNGQDATNPAEDVERPAAEPASTTLELTDDEAEALASAAAGLGAKTATLVSLFLRDGLKLGEALSADVDDFTTPPPTLTITRQARPHRLRLEATTGVAVAACVGDRVTGPLFVGTPRGDPSQRLTRSGADYLVKRAAANAGITKAVSANSLRRHYVKVAHDEGVALDEIRERLGHYDRRTTSRLLPGSARNDPKEENHAHSIRPVP